MPQADDEVLVIGHRNPDTDAICSALAYADLYGQLTGARAVACHLDEIGPEAQWLLTHLGLEAPRPVTDVYLRVAEVMVTGSPHLRLTDTVRTAGLLMREHELGALPVLDADGKLAGMLPRELLADRYLDMLQLTARVRRPLGVIRAVLEADLLTGDPELILDGQLWMGTFSPEAARANLKPGDLLLVEDDAPLQRAGIDSGARCLIVARDAPVDPVVLARAEAAGGAVMRTAYNSLAAAALIEQSAPAAAAMQPDPTSVAPEDLLRDAQQQLRSGSRASLPVVDPGGRYLGLLLRRHLVSQGRRRVILTDHNHADQGAPGITESEILAIIDHHNLGGLQTLQPLSMLVEPVGCTCTLIAEGYSRAGLTPSAALAGAMLGAILSDTVGFRSPTTTPRDREAAMWLAGISGRQPDELARRLFRARLPDPPPPAPWWIQRDWKSYSFGTTRIGIAQVELVDVEEVAPPGEELRRELARMVAAEGLDTGFLLLTDIFEQGSVLLAADEIGERIAAQAFGGRIDEHQLELPGIVSRKQQVIPVIAAACNTGR